MASPAPQQKSNEPLTTVNPSVMEPAPEPPIVSQTNGKSNGLQARINAKEQKPKNTTQPKSQDGLLSNINPVYNIKYKENGKEIVDTNFVLFDVSSISGTTLTKNILSDEQMNKIINSNKNNIQVDKVKKLLNEKYKGRLIKSLTPEQSNYSDLQSNLDAMENKYSEMNTKFEALTISDLQRITTDEEAYFVLRKLRSIYKVNPDKTIKQLIIFLIKHFGSDKPYFDLEYDELSSIINDKETSKEVYDLLQQYPQLFKLTKSEKAQIIKEYFVRIESISDFNKIVSNILNLEPEILAIVPSKFFSNENVSAIINKLKGSGFYTKAYEVEDFLNLPSTKSIFDLNIDQLLTKAIDDINEDELFKLIYRLNRFLDLDNIDKETIKKIQERLRVIKSVRGMSQDQYDLVTHNRKYADPRNTTKEIEKLENEISVYKKLVADIKADQDKQDIKYTKPESVVLDSQDKNKVIKSDHDSHVDRHLPKFLQSNINKKAINDIINLFNENKNDLERNPFQNIDFDFSILKQQLAQSFEPDEKNRNRTQVNQLKRATDEFKDKYDKETKDFDSKIAALYKTINDQKQKSSSTSQTQTETNLLDQIKQLQEQKKEYEEKARAVYPLFIIDIIKDSHKDFTKSIIALLNNYKNKMTTFISSLSRRLLYLQRWKRDIELKKEYNTKYTAQDDFLKTYDEKIKKAIESIKNAIIVSLQTLEQKYNDKCIEFKKTVGQFISDSDPIFLGFLKQQEGVRKYIATTKQKLLSLYNNERTIMDIVVDSKFTSIYILKFVHFAIFVAALFLTEKLFLEMYMKKVYAENSDPPSIYKMLGILLLIDIGFTLFLVTVLVLLMYIFDSPGKNFVINSNLIITFLLDLGIYLFFVLMISMIIGSIIQMKRYFRYKTEGLRGIRAFKEIVLGVAGSLTFIPFFVVL